jgi:hypothetical protein
MIRRFVKRWFNLYDLQDLTTEAHCGICGKAVVDVVPKDWPWSLCEDH